MGRANDRRPLVLHRNLLLSQRAPLVSAQKRAERERRVPSTHYEKEQRKEQKQSEIKRERRVD